MKRSSVLLGLTLAAVLCAAAFAQTGDPVPDAPLIPPEVKEVGSPPTIWAYIVMVFLIALAVVANLIPSKRGHQD